MSYILYLSKLILGFKIPNMNIFFFQVRDLTKCGRDRFIYSIFTPLTKGSWSRFVISPYKLGSRYLVMQDTGCKGKLDMDGS